MNKTTVVIPNYNGYKYLQNCLDSLLNSFSEDTICPILVIDNGSTDQSLELLRQYPQVQIIALPQNTGFSHAVNVGIQAAKTPYVILLNNDTEVRPDFVHTLTQTIESNPQAFSVGAKMLRMDNPLLTDNAGDLYCVFGWAFARGKDRPATSYQNPTAIFSACAGAAIYRRQVFQQIGYFDEAFFAYLEDVDIGYRARTYGYQNLYEPKAQVLHAGSAASGSRYNTFKTPLTAANSVTLIAKNMPLPQRLLNLPFLIFGFLVKALFFARKKMLHLYLKGLLTALHRPTTPTHAAPIPPLPTHTPIPTRTPIHTSTSPHTPTFRHYLNIQLQLYQNTLRLITKK